jgi:hypothetical protein
MDLMQLVHDQEGLPDGQKAEFTCSLTLPRFTKHNKHWTNILKQEAKLCRSDGTTAKVSGF